MGISHNAFYYFLQLRSRSLSHGSGKISISIDRRYRIMYMSYLRLRHVTRIAAMRLGCILFCLRVSCVSRG